MYTSNGIRMISSELLKYLSLAIRNESRQRSKWPYANVGKIGAAHRSHSSREESKSYEDILELIALQQPTHSPPYKEPRAASCAARHVIIWFKHRDFYVSNWRGCTTIKNRNLFWCEDWESARPSSLKTPICADLKQWLAQFVTLECQNLIALLQVATFTFQLLELQQTSPKKKLCKKTSYPSKVALIQRLCPWVRGLLWGGYIPSPSAAPQRYLILPPWTIKSCNCGLKF